MTVYVNDTGPITKVCKHPSPGASKPLPDNAAAVAAFRWRPIPGNFSAEDLFNKLVELGVLQESDRP